MRISDWSSDVCSSDLRIPEVGIALVQRRRCAGGCRIRVRDDRVVLDTVGDVPQRADAAGNVVDVAELVGADAGEVLQMAVALVVVDAETQLEAVRHRRVQHRLDALHAEVATGTFEVAAQRSEEHTSELQSLMRIPYAVFCL